VNEEEEKNLINVIMNSEGEWEILQLRTVKHWGYKYDYKTKLISPNTVPPIPQFFQKVIDRIVAEKILPFAPDQITVNIYEPGNGIPNHIETHSVFDSWYFVQKN
jgi:alkylated DNA repair protein alkB family protein 8